MGGGGQVIKDTGRDTQNRRTSIFIKGERRTFLDCNTFNEHESRGNYKCCAPVQMVTLGITGETSLEGENTMNIGQELLLTSR